MDFVFPFVFCLTSRQTEQTFAIVYRELKRRAVELGFVLSPEGFIMDMELANVNAARAAFRHTRVQTCLFHFNQALNRNVVSFGLGTDYETLDGPIRKQLVALMALPFIPLDDVVEVYENMTADMDERFVSYMESTYVLEAMRRRRRAPPRFPPELRNVYELTLAGFQRTNNAVEGWHNRLEKICVVHHALLWRFLDAIRLEENQIRTSHPTSRVA